MTLAVDLRHSARHGRPGMTADDAEARLQCLLDVGFSEAQADHVFEALDLPPVAVITGKIADLKRLGFADPVKMITSLPAILGYAIDNITGKIADLKRLGFADPVKMITSLPAILGLAIDNITGKIADLKRLGFADPVKMITSSPAILGYSRERFILCAQIVAHLDDRRDSMVARIIGKRRPIIDAVAAARPTAWTDVLAILAAGKKAA